MPDAHGAWFVGRRGATMATVKPGVLKTILMMPLLKHGAVRGYFAIYQEEVRANGLRHSGRCLAIPPRPMQNCVGPCHAVPLLYPPLWHSAAALQYSNTYWRGGRVILAFASRWAQAVPGFFANLSSAMFNAPGPVISTVRESTLLRYLGSCVSRNLKESPKSGA